MTAEILMRPQGMSFGFGFEATTLPAIPVRDAAEIESMEGIGAAVPIVQYLSGSDLIDGVDFNQYSRVLEARVVAGRAVQSGDEVMIDDVVRLQKKLKLGDDFKILGRPFRIVGIYAPESLSRYKVPIATLQPTSAARICAR